LRNGYFRGLSPGLNFWVIFTSNQPLKETEDKEILEKYRLEESRNAAIGMLVSKYQKRLYWHIRKIVISHDDCDDVLQNTFIKAWKGLENFREESSLFTWMYRIATNEALSHLRQKSNSKQVSIHPIEYQLSASLEADVYFKGDEIQMKLQKAILTLPEKQRIVFNMRYYDEMPYEQMSTILETSVGALKASYHIAAKKIEDLLKTG
jgi:RNA polymerase sigma factor (sigma-70 family)